MAEFDRNLAIIIGIDNYERGIPALQTAVNDAQTIAQILEQKHDYKIWQFIDAQATLNKLNQLLDNLPRFVRPSDRLTFYFAGHGIALNGDDGPEGYLIPQDAQLGNTASYLPMARLQKALNKLSCRHFLTILDCCFAGAFRWSSTRDLLIVPEVIHRQHYDRFIETSAWQVITSASHNQTASDNLALEDRRGEVSNHHSPFAAALIEALQGGADASPPAKDGKPPGDGVITATELYLYLRDRVEVATEKNGTRQTPGLHPLSKHDRGEYVFLTPGHELNLPPAPPLDESLNPYRGLESFDESHSGLFFGRQALTKQLYQFILQHPLTVVLGASGTGKSSLVKAGLIPYIQQLSTAKNHWQVLPPMRPGDLPFKELNKILSEYGSTGSSILNLVSREQKTVLSRKIKCLLAADARSKLLLVIDQTEELTTLCRNPTKRDSFLAMLAEWLKKYPQQLRIVLTLRSDFEPQFRNLVFKPFWQKSRFIVPAMTREELREAIEKPAAARTMYFEPHSLVDRLIDEVAQMPGALPLLSFALSELYIKYLLKFRAGIRDKRAITQEDYEEIGGVAQSLTQRADKEYTKLVDKDPAYAQTIRCIMLRAIALGSGELARRRVLLSELEYPEPENSRVKEIIRRFSAARLLVEGQNIEGKPYVEPAHDALVRGWQKLLVWKQEEEDSIILQRRLTPVAQEWKNLEYKQKNTGLLTKTEPVMNWVDARLYAVENLFYIAKDRLFGLIRQLHKEQNRLIAKPEQFLWNANPYLNVLKEKLSSSNYLFNQTEAEFLKRSLRRKRNNSRRLIGSVAIVILALSLLAIVALISNQRARESNKKANDALDNLRVAKEKNNLAERELLEARTKKNLAEQQLQEALEKSNLALNDLKEDLENKTINENLASEKIDEIVQEAEQQEQQALQIIEEAEQQEQQALEIKEEAEQQEQQALESTDDESSELNTDEPLKSTDNDETSESTIDESSEPNIDDETSEFD